MSTYDQKSKPTSPASAAEITRIAEASKEIMTSNDAKVIPGSSGSRGSTAPAGNKK